jgi:hypothetical protein
VDPEGQELWFTDGVPELRFDDIDTGLKAAASSVIDVDKLKKLLKTVFAEEVEADLLDVILDDFMREEFCKAIGSITRQP